MRKSNLRVRVKPVKRSYAKAYIIAAGFSAVLCAVLFSFVLMPDKKIEQDIKIKLPEIETEEIAPVSEPLEIEIPNSEEIIAPIEEVPKKEEEKEVFKSDTIELMMPTDGVIMKGYSNQKPVKSETMGDWRVHNGIDIKAEAKSAVKAPFRGKVILKEKNKLTGNTISIDHENGFVSTLYNLESISAEVGQKVEKGDVIGTVGNSAAVEALEDAHVHFELRKDGKLQNPEKYIK